MPGFIAQHFIIPINSLNFRATLLLVPLLGMQFILTPFRPEPGHPWEIIYEIISAFTASFQVCVVLMTIYPMTFHQTGNRVEAGARIDIHIKIKWDGRGVHMSSANNG